MNVSDPVAGRFLQAGGRLQVKSALNPCLWMCAIVTMPCLIAYVYTECIALLFFAVAPVLITCIGFIYLLVHDRDKLQSEDFQIRKQSLELIYDKGLKAPIDAKAVERISNPDMPPIQQVALSKEIVL